MYVYVFCRTVSKNECNTDYWWCTSITRYFKWLCTGKRNSLQYTIRISFIIRNHYWCNGKLDSSKRRVRLYVTI